MVHRKATPKARRERVSMDTTTPPPQQQHEVANADEETSAIKTKTKKGSRRGSRDSSTIDSPRRKETKHSAGGKAKRSKTESQGAFPEHRRVIPLTEELREAILAAHSSGVVLKKLKPEFHPDLKVEKRVPAEATTTTTPSPQPALAESKALRELVTLQGMYIKLKDLALHQHTDITRLQAENQAVNAALQRTLAKCNLYKQQLDYQMQRQQQQRASNQFQSVDHSRGSANTIALLQQLAATGAMDTSGTQQPSASASPIHLGAFSATVPSASSVPSLFPVLRQDSFGGR
ncbi:hypothetical protein Pmar_PMAR014901 [Perkinsus marinus ATCC 50983]|uniref:Uncharacterized protein n=1 Tax=Perkinsus marinus (strain ATCC 50983 / TXsc) TaxID=423536 RepID=C5L578_PERM5|nr:hypothetical protein Pmar_PMAR014901 [Perkinsus marinus ATCC 50983]EER08137.1 hypothetical protein Pmar_PMAR014901 [Perkinsus marinus ATCC 50983]|eukprot:XP_002776321.1 hypothetical protein Pmar_PMAR014901 [Perkinsus marinus ATCC 50983]